LHNILCFSVSGSVCIKIVVFIDFVVYDYMQTDPYWSWYWLVVLHCISFSFARKVFLITMT